MRMLPLKTDWDKKTYDRDIYIDSDGVPDPDISFPHIAIVHHSSNYQSECRKIVTK